MPAKRFLKGVGSLASAAGVRQIIFTKNPCLDHCFLVFAMLTG
ncbi:hypothetical protein DNO_1012 [Dichelobacter nodosus VCS1703A]|uniref:Uncharacterized protein n=1 Tax=Dichelobacter nodosus (strain VCS1703A) TaxID=246195 RepID=A5EXX9_DICNV|nr:hypothetical protein DNO_1012 [Dichelobacter nodosus VCS1703A]